MAKITLFFGLLLSLLGLGAYAGATRRHITTLIPTLLGFPLLALGLAGRKEQLTEDTTYVASGLSLLGLVVSLQGLLFPQLFSSTAAESEEHPKRRLVQASTAALTGAYLTLAVKSYK